MNHDNAASLLDAYLDNELDVATTASIDAHLQECTACAAWIDARRKLISRVRSSPLRYELPPSLQNRLAREWTRSSSSGRGSFGWPQSLAAALVLAVGGFWLGRGMPNPSTLDDQLVSAHVRSLLDSHAVDVPSSDHHTVKPWFAGKLPFSPPVPELNGGADELLGGRLDYVERTRVAVLVYRHEKHLISVFVFPHGTAAPRWDAKTALDGYHVLRAQAGPVSAAFVSDMNSDELAAFRRRWSEAAARS